MVVQVVHHTQVKRPWQQLCMDQIIQRTSPHPIIWPVLKGMLFNYYNLAVLTANLAVLTATCRVAALLLQLQIECSFLTLPTGHYDCVQSAVPNVRTHPKICIAQS